MLLGEEGSKSREIHICLMLNFTDVGVKNYPTKNLRTRKLHANSQFFSTERS